VPEIGEFVNGVWETLKLGGIGHIWLFPIGVFPLLIALVTTLDISIVEVPTIGESTSGVRETSKLGGTGFI